MDDSLVKKIARRYQDALENIARHAQKAGRNPDDVRLVVVTKSQPLEVVQAAIEAGAHRLGENYPEEALSKINVLTGKKRVEWHMIGHIQSRKARLVAGNFALIHSVDRLKIADKLSRLAQEQNLSLPVLLEFNVGGETSKAGWAAADEASWESLLPDMETVLALPGLDVCGLMTMPPLMTQPDAARVYFQRLRRLRDWLARRFPQAHWRELSMGTSGDYPAAVEEGATLVRIGRAVVGPRRYKEKKEES